MKISERIKEYRKLNNLTQKELSEKLFVSKQAVSKWENDLGLPDVSLYPVLAELFGISIDELMGVKTIKEDNIKKYSKNKVILISCFIILIVIALIVSITIFTNKRDILPDLIDTTEKNLDVTLPDIYVYEYVDTSDMSHVNSWYPQNTYYFIFEDNEKLQYFEKNIVTSTGWLTTIPESIKEMLPLNAKPYCDTCQYFKLIDKESNLNIIIPPINKGKYNFVLYCYQSETNRLIAISFKYEVM